MSLEKYRQQIDELDQQLIDLLVQRVECVHEIGRIKLATGAQIYAPEREERLLKALVNYAQGKLPEKSLRAIYREIMSLSLALEKNLVIAFLGPLGTWTHQAARHKFGASVKYSAQHTVFDVFKDVERGHTDYGVVPVENSTEGAVNHTLDQFVDSPLQICAEIPLMISQNLISRYPLENITRVYSHPQSFGQCRNWLRSHLLEADLIEVSSNARAVQLADSEEGSAALAGELAAEIYGVPVVAAAVHDEPNNITRFLVVGNRSSPPTGTDKTSIMFTVRDQAGALLNALKPFEDHGISLSKIESRPAKRRPWEYFFFIDARGHKDDQALQAALSQLKAQATEIKILGSYPAATAC